ncbi:MAG: GtrA family protein [Gammaproteobacteria bacterium]|nr:GtrA family protein [Gammaproteobacteria bacterium]
MIIKRFSRYLSVGVVNTLIHWLVFLLLNLGFDIPQSWSNLLAFTVAVTFSFFANARFTFQAKATSKRYFLFTSAMGGLSFLIGTISDALAFAPLITLVAFSSLSLVLGFAYSHWFVFKERA